MAASYHLHLKGYVGGSDFDSDYVDFVLSKNKGKEVCVLIDSLGGSLPTALSIASAFRNHGNVRVHFVGMNASAATIASMGAKHISIDRNAMYLVHKVASSFFEFGTLNADDIKVKIEEYKKMKSDLEKMDGNIADMYANRCKRDPKDLLSLMKKGGWLSAQEALDWGFVDEISSEACDLSPVLTNSLVASMEKAGMPVPQLPVVNDPEQSSDSLFRRFMAYMVSIFNSNNNSKLSNINSKISMKKVFNSVCAVLALDALDFEDGFTTLSEEQVNSLENSFKDKDESVTEKEKTINDLNGVIESLKSQIDSLNSEISALKAAPGDTTTSIVENNRSSVRNEKSMEEDYFDSLNEARKLYNLIK